MQAIGSAAAVAGSGSLAAGFQHPVFDSQKVFRAVMQAMAGPATAMAFDITIEAPDGINPSLAALMLALADSDTPVWLDAELAGNDAVAAFLRFHTGAPITDSAADAAFAFAASPEGLPALSDFAQGSAEYPDRSTTIVTATEVMRASGWRFHGPGLARPVYWSAAGLADEFAGQWRRNAARFPCGVDVVFVTEDEIAALPRSCRLAEG